MARTAAQRAAFRKMIAANKRSRKSRKRTARKSPRRKSRRRNPHTGVSIMPSALLVNPRRKRRKNRRKARRNRRARRNTGALLVNRRRRRRSRRNPGALLVNRRRRGGMRRRRRNPGMAGGIIGKITETVKLAIPATIGGVAMGFIDGKLPIKNPIARIGIKVAAAAGATMFGRKFLGPQGAAAMGGAMLGTIGYDIGLRLSGKGAVVSPQKDAAKAGLAAIGAIGAEDDEVGELLETNGLGLILQGFGDDDDVGDDGSDTEGMGQGDQMLQGGMGAYEEGMLGNDEDM